MVKLDKGESMTKKTWNEKLKEKGNLPKIVKLEGKKAERWGGKTMAIACPMDVDALMKKVPEGYVTTVAKLREKIAKKYKTEIACPLTTGIFTWIAAHAAEEAKASGAKEITPWWRTLKGQGELNSKYPGGVLIQRKLLEKEGVKFEPVRGKAKIKNLENYLV